MAVRFAECTLYDVSTSANFLLQEGTAQKIVLPVLYAKMMCKLQLTCPHVKL